MPKPRKQPRIFKQIYARSLAQALIDAGKEDEVNNAFKLSLVTVNGELVTDGTKLCKTLFELCREEDIKQAKENFDRDMRSFTSEALGFCHELRKANKEMLKKV